ncbi:MAG: hypothetical protein ABIZ72_04830, partial [Candidatus Limnocylindrales bacterium]
AASWLPAATSILALLFALALLDQWRERRQAFQLIWAIGMLFYGVASGCEAIGALTGWNEALYRTWYLTGAIWTAGWLGLGTAFLLGRTRFGYTFALCLVLAGIFTLLTERKFHYAGSGTAPILYLIGAIVLALAVAIETYFQNDRWPMLAAGAVVGATALALVLMLTTPLAAPGYALDSATGAPTGELLPGTIRLLTPFLNITGGFALILGALFSAYVFMPKRRVLGYSLDPTASGDQFLFNLLISPVAIVVNFVASLPGAVRALFAGRLHSRVPATILIAIGGMLASGGDALNRFGVTNYFQVGKFLAVGFLLAGFLVSIETFRQVRIPFTSIRFGGRRVEHGPVGDDGRALDRADRAERLTGGTRAPGGPPLSQSADAPADGAAAGPPTESPARVIR